MENESGFLIEHPQQVVATLSNLSGFAQRLARPNLRSALRRRVKMRPFLTLANCKCRSVTHLYLLRHSVARLLARSAIGSSAHSFVKLCAWWLIHDIIQASGWILDSNSHSVAQLLNTMCRPGAAMQVSKPLELQLYPGPKPNWSFTSPGAVLVRLIFIFVAQSRLR